MVLKNSCCFIFKLQDPCYQTFLHVLNNIICGWNKVFTVNTNWKNKEMWKTQRLSLDSFQKHRHCCAVAKNVSQLETDCHSLTKSISVFMSHGSGSIPRQSLYMAVVSQLRSVHTKGGPFYWAVFALEFCCAEIHLLGCTLLLAPLPNHIFSPFPSQTALLYTSSGIAINISYFCLPENSISSRTGP